MCWKPIAGLAKTLKNECIFLLCSGGGYQTVFLRHQNSFLFVEEPMKDEETIRCSFCFINACEEKQEIHFIFIFFCHLSFAKFPVFKCGNYSTVQKS